MNYKTSTLALLCALLCINTAKSESKRPPYQYPAEPEVLQKLKDWQELKFGLFMHWGSYSQWGVVESWTLCPEDQPWIVRPKDKSYFEYVRDYEKLITTFNPVKFDPDKWASAAKQAGMKYVVFTTKHHDGFNMFDTAQSDYKITGTTCPFRSNPRANVAKEIFDAFRKEKMMVGAYYSITDWHNDDFWWKYFPPSNRNINYSPKKYPEKWALLNDFIYKQLDELTSGYGKMDMLWFDLIGVSKELKVDWPRFADMARKNQPGIMMVARGANDQYENYRTPEQEVPDQALDYPWETCMTMANQWSYKPNDNYKPASRIIQLLVQIVSRGGNFLLNIGPGPDGDFDPIAYERLKEIGDWMKINGEAIYGTRTVKPYHETKLVFTKKDDHVYAAYLPDTEEKNLPASLAITSMQPVDGSQLYLLGYEKPLEWEKAEKGFSIKIPPALQAAPPCHYAWVFKFKVQ